MNYIEKVKVWAHRGASGYMRENTLEAFRLAADQGADGVELDVQICKSGELVVIHDEKIDRVSNGKGYVKDFTLKELKYFSEGRIPCLQDVYQVLKRTSLTINVELKTGIILYENIEEKVLELEKDMGMEGRIMYSSFNHYSVSKIKKLNPLSKIGLLFADGFMDVPTYGSNLGADALHPAFYHLQVPGFLEDCRRNKLEVNVWTVNSPIMMRTFCEMGVDAIITNYPDIARRIVDETYMILNN